MNKENTDKYKTPTKLLLFQFVTLPLFGVGVSDKLNDSYKFVPENLQFQNYQLVLIVLGLFGIILELVYIYKFYKSKSKI